MNGSVACAAAALGCSLLSLSMMSACRKQEPPPPYAGALTAERIAIARERVHIRADWDDTVAEIESEAGRATAGAIDQRTWAVLEGGKCSFLTITRKGQHVTSVQHQPLIGPEVEANYDECAALAHPIHSAAR